MGNRSSSSQDDDLVRSGGRVEYGRQISSAASWAALSAPSPPFTDAIKVVVDRSDASLRTYFLESRVRFKYHLDFCLRLAPTCALNFNQVMYQSPERRFVLYTLLRQSDGDGDTYWLELWPGDALCAADILRTTTAVRQRVFFAERLHFRCASEQQSQAVAAELTAEERQQLRLLESDALYRNVRYQALTVGTAVGRLRIVRDSDGGALTASDIAVLESVPLEIVPVAGLVTAQLQTPLAHVAVLCFNRGTPNCCVMGATSLPSFVDADGQWVRLSVTRTGYTLQPSSEHEAAAAAAAAQRKMVKRAPLLTRNVDVDGLLPLAAGGRALPANVVGSKAAALARLYAVRKLAAHAVPGFALPFAYYQRLAVDQCPAVRQLLADLLALPRRHTGSAALLAQLRQAIVEAPLPADLLRDVRAAIAAWRQLPAYADLRGVIFRSSSNCEDLAGFSGAGLAESYPLRRSDGDDFSLDDIARCIKSVWASLWLERGYLERSVYQIDHSQAAMAVLVQPLVEHDAHVVAVTTNPFKHRAIPCYFLNLLPAGQLVTDAQDASCEQLLLYDDEPVCVEQLAPAKLAGSPLDRSLLPEAHYARLLAMLKKLHTTVRNDNRKKCKAADVEFVITPHPPYIVLLQARPYGTGDEWAEDEVEEQRPVVYRAYRWRYVVLAMFCSFSIVQNIVWISIGSYSKASQRFYGVGRGAVALTFVVSNVVGGVFVPGTAWLLDKHGLRPTLLAATAAVFVGSTLMWAAPLLFGVADAASGQLLGVTPAGWYLTIAGYLLNAVGGPCSLAAPPKLSGMFFAPDERALSSSIGVTAGSLGGALGFLLALAVAPVDQSTPAQTAADVSDQLLLHWLLAGAVLAVVVGGFPNAPPTPSSRSADRDTAELDLHASVKRLAGNVSFLSVTMVGGCSQGVFWAWLPLLSINLQPLGYSSVATAWLGFSITVAGIVGGLLIGYFAAALGTKHKPLVCLFYAAAALFFLVFTVITSQWIDFAAAYWVAAVAATVGGLLLSGAEPLFYELGVEVAYPAGEGLVGTVVSTMFGAAQLLVMSLPLGARTLNWLNTVSAAVSAGLLLLTNITYRRYTLDVQRPAIEVSLQKELIDDASNDDDDDIQFAGPVILS